MQTLKNKIQMLLLLCVFCASCGDDCKTTYRPEVGIGFVFMYDTNNNTSYPVEGAKITVKNIYKTFGLLGKTIDLATNTYTTDTEGKYQVRFLEKGCSEGEEVYCNLYRFYYENKLFFGFYGITSVQDNVKKIDTIKLYK